MWQFCGWGNFQKYWKKSQIEFHSQKLTCKAKKEPWKRKTSTNHNFIGFDMLVFGGVEGNSFRAIQNKFFCLWVAPPLPANSSDIWASNIIITRMCFVSAVIPFYLRLPCTEKIKWSISYYLSNIQNKPWNDIPRVILMGFYIQILTMALPNKHG